MPSGFKIAGKQPRAPNDGEIFFEIGEVSWESLTGQLSIKLRDAFGVVEVLFVGPVSFRSQDEGDMLEHWDVIREENVAGAIIYTIDKSEYIESLAGNSISSMTSELRHWLIVGNHQCVEAVTDATHEPFISELERFQDQ